MIAISAADVTPAVQALFEEPQPTLPRAWNVLDGTVRGAIMVDDLAAPTWAVVRDAIFGTLYFGGRINAALVATLVGHFRERGEVGIGCWQDAPLEAMLPPDPGYDGRTLYFTERAAEVALPPLQRALPPGLRIAERDAELLPQSFDYAAALELFGSAEALLQRTLGVVVLDDAGRVVCEAVTGAATHGRIEVGVTTAEAQRERGLATIACARLIELCEARGLATWWDCARQNTASARLAHTLGYRRVQEYRYVWWPGR